MRKLIWIFICIATLLAGCNDVDNNNLKEGKLIVKLTDAPGDYQEVLIDVQELLVHVTSEEDTGWIQLPLEITEPIDLLTLTNGNDTVLTQENIPAGDISQIRMVLGENNRVKVDDEYFDLQTPSAQQSGLKFNIHTTLGLGVTYELWIDFDAARSVIKKGNGDYLLKPTIKVFTEATSGGVKGSVNPIESKPVIHAISTANDTTSTYADETTGLFTIKGLNEGTYRLVLVPVDGFVEKEIDDVEIVIGSVTDVGEITIDQETI